MEEKTVSQDVETQQAEKAENQEDKLKLNYPFIIGYTFCLGIGVLQTAFSLNGNTVVTPIFQAKFGWSDQETIFNNTLISTSAIVGMALGSLVGGKTVTIGRRKAGIYM